MAKVELKQPIVQEISDLLSDAKAAVLVDYAGLTVARPCHPWYMWSFRIG